MNVMSMFVSARERLGWTQSQVAPCMGLSQPGLSHLENKKAGNVKLGDVARYAAVFSAEVGVVLRPHGQVPPC